MTEKIILKNIINRPDFFNKVKPLIEKDIFDIQNNIIYDNILDFYKQYSSVPNYTELETKIANADISQELKKSALKSLDEIKNADNVKPEFLDDLTTKFIKDKLFMKSLILGSDYLEKHDDSLKNKAFETIEKMNKVTINSDLGSDYQNIEERLDYYQKPEKGINYTEFEEMRKMLGNGILPGTLNLFLAPPGVGKSMMMSASICDFLKQGKNILLVSMEMSNFEFMKRIDANLLDLPINDLGSLDGQLIRDKFNNLSIGKLFVQNFPSMSFSAGNLDALLDLYKSNNINIDIVFLDYLGIMKSDLNSRRNDLYQYIKSIGEEVRAVAMRWKIPIFSASQLNRSAINNAEADNSSISDSLGTAMTADFMCFLIQPEEYKKEGKIVFKITKNRYTGRTETFTMNVDYSRMKFLNVYNPDSLIEKQSIDKQINNTIKNEMVIQSVNDFWKN